MTNDLTLRRPYTRLYLSLVLMVGLLMWASSNLRAQTANNTQLVGSWSAQRGASDFVLVLNAGGSGTLNYLDIRWEASGEKLSLFTSKGNFHYRFSIHGDSLTLSGSDLKQPLAFTRAKAGTGELLDGRAELPIPGNPPLTEDTVNKGIQLFEWLLDAQLTLEQRAEFRGSLVRTWKARDQEGIDGTMNTLRFQDQLQSKSPEERALIREQLCQKFLALMRQTPNAVLSRWVLNIYDSAHRPIAAGNPPLTSQVADAYAEFVSFMLTECLGKSVFHADRRFKDELARSLAAQYSSYAPQQQKQFSEVPLLWEALRFKWAQLSERERADYRKQWTPTVTALLANASQGTDGAQTGAASGGTSSLDNYRNHYSEHLFVQSMSNSSFTTSMNLHLNMWR